MKYVAKRNILLTLYIVLNVFFATIIRLTFSIPSEIIKIGSFEIAINSISGSQGGLT